MTTTKRADESTNTNQQHEEIKKDNEDDDTCSMNSSDEALCEMLGFTSLDDMKNSQQTNASLLSSNNKDEQNEPSPSSSTTAVSGCSYNIPSYTSTEINSILSQQQQQQHPNNTNGTLSPKSLLEIYQKESLLLLPQDISIPSSTMRKLTNELMYGDVYPSDKTYETIQYKSSSSSDGEKIQSRRVLTRLENFVSRHEGWYHLCHHTIPSILNTILLQKNNSDDDDDDDDDNGEKKKNDEYVLYKEKLNIKPPGGSGFAPHLDTPSLRLVFGTDGPQDFLTVMIAIDDMTSDNGCLRVVKGLYNSEKSAVEVIPPDENGNPDAEGRAGAIPLNVADELEFEDVVCKGGRIAVFNGWIPHRSKVNGTAFSRRAVFLTYNLKTEGCFRERYYAKMREWRSGWRARGGSGGGGGGELEEEEKKGELDALKTIPRI